MNETELQFFAPTPMHRELRILIEIERDPQVSQKELARSVGLAPSMVNNYMKQLSDEQKVMKRGPNHKRITYHLTDAGERHRSGLLAQYLLEGLRLYQTLAEDLKRRLRRIQREGVSSVMLLGGADACEVVEKAAREIGLTVDINQPPGQHRVAAAHGSGSEHPAGGGSVFAVLLASAQEDPGGAAAVRRYREDGLQVYTV